MIGVGLHSYGFMDEERVALIAFVASQLALVALGSPRGRKNSSLGALPIRAASVSP
jgi:hypothetical protein